MSESSPELSPESASRRPRADALRNRELILTVARDVFAKRGASVTLDDIVKLTGLGVGTLYRHFPTRDALIEAVYLAEVERLAEAQRTLSATEPAVEALRRWMMLFVDFIATKAAMKETLSGLIGGPDSLYACSTELIKTAIDALTDRAVASGEIRLDIDPLDLLRALSGVAHAGDESSPARAERLVDILIAGLRTQ
jgi:AcrR family transcriptional regulator